MKDGDNPVHSQLCRGTDSMIHLLNHDKTHDAPGAIKVHRCFRRPEVFNYFSGNFHPSTPVTTSPGLQFTPLSKINISKNHGADRFFCQDNGILTDSIWPQKPEFVVTVADSCWFDRRGLEVVANADGTIADRWCESGEGNWTDQTGRRTELRTSGSRPCDGQIENAGAACQEAGAGCTFSEFTIATRAFRRPAPKSLRFH
jgi:hypothetical protein